MKKNLLLLLALIGFSNQSHSQYYGDGFLCLDCYGNIEVGANLTTIPNMEGAKPRIGFSAALNNYKEFNENIYLKFGISYHNLGAKFENEDTEDLTIHTIGGTVGINYVQQRDYQFFGGLQIEGNILKNWMYSDDVDINFLTYSIYGGAGLIFAENIELSVKYNLGLANLSNNSEDNWKRSYLSLTLGYTFF